MKSIFKRVAGFWCFAATIGVCTAAPFPSAPGPQVELDTQLLNAVRDNDSTMAEIKSLLQQGAHVDARDDRGDTALLNALRWGGPHVAATLLDNKANIRAIDNAGWNALMLAANSGDVENVKLVLKRDPYIDINFHDRDGETSLMLASEQQNNGIVPFLLTRGASVNLRNKQSETALMQTARWSDASIVTALVDKGADINAVNLDGDTTLMLAARVGNGAVVKALLKHGANTEIVNHEGKTALELALDAKQAEVIRLLTPVH